MSIYTVKVVTKLKETVDPCDGYTVSFLPEDKSSVYYRYPEIQGIPKGKTVRLDLWIGTPQGDQKIVATVYGGPRSKVFIMNQQGKTIDRYPKGKNERIVKGFRVIEEEEEKQKGELDREEPEGEAVEKKEQRQESDPGKGVYSDPSRAYE